MEFSTWHGLHIFGMVLLLCGLCGIVFKGKDKVFLLTLTYIGLLLILVSGGFNSALIFPDLKFSLWVIFKFLLWIVFLALPFVKKIRESKWAVVVILILTALEIYLGLHRPTFTRGNEVPPPIGMPNGPPTPVGMPNGPPPKIQMQPPKMQALPPPPFGDTRKAPPPPKPYKPPVPAPAPAQ